MKAVVLHEYGPPSRLIYETVDDPVPAPGEVLVRVHAVSVNPIDWKIRSGAARERFPISFPAILGRDLAGTVAKIGEGVQGVNVVDRVFAVSNRTYAEFCVVKATDLAHIPEGLELTTAGAVPLVAITGHQLIRRAANVQSGQTIILTGALGSVGRCALFAALEIGANVIAGVRKQQMDEVTSLGAMAAIDLDDDKSIASVGTIDAVADTVNGVVAAKLIAKVKSGGNFGSVVGPPSNAALHPTVHVNAIMATPDPKTYVHYGEAIRDGKLKLPIDSLMPLEQTAAAHTLAEKGGVGKVILTA